MRMGGTVKPVPAKAESSLRTPRFCDISWRLNGSGLRAQKSPPLPIGGGGLFIGLGLRVETRPSLFSQFALGSDKAAPESRPLFQQVFSDVIGGAGVRSPSLNGFSEI